CLGTAVVCEEPPEPECSADDAVLRVYASVGQCDPASGGCVYAPTDVPCLSCRQACLLVCEGVLCPDLEGGCLSGGRCDPTTEPAGCAYEAPAADDTPCFLEGQTDEHRGRCLSGRCLEQGGPTTLYLDAGLLSGSDTFAGRVFVPLSPYAIGTVHDVFESSVAIDNTLYDALYQRQLWPPAGETMSFVVAVPNGAYTLHLHNAETTAGATAGSRVFQVRVNGSSVLQAWDIFADSGQLNRAVRRSFDVEVSGGELRLDFVPSGGGQPPKICGIEIVPRGAAPLPLEDETPECAGDGDCDPDSTGVPYCRDGDVYADAHGWSCEGGHCRESITPVLQEECVGDTRCSAGACVPTGTTLAWQLHAAMGKGINGYGVVNDGSCALSPDWDESYFQLLAEAGFGHIRLVIYGFTGGGGPDYAIDPATLTNLQAIIDLCIAAGLIPVLDYHAPAFLSDPTQAHKDAFVSHWGQLASFFAGYPYTNLVFELTNEPIAPTGGLSFADWNQLLAAAVSAIRAHDAERVVLVSPGYWANVSGLPQLELPADEALMVSFHYYDPHTFTHQCASWIEDYDQCCGEEWYPIQEFRDEIARHFAPAVAYSAAHNIPVHVGEFGTYQGGPMESRARYLNYLARYFESVGFIWCHWDFLVDFNIFDRGSGTFFPELLEALMDAPMPAVWPSSVTPIYQSDFSSTTDGWTLETQNGANASLSVSNGELVVSITSPGSDGWDIRLSRSTPLLQGHTYQLGWTARAAGNRGWAVFRIGSNIPWVNIYDLDEGGTSFTRSWTFSFLDQPGAVVSFGLGGDTTGFILSELDFSEISID
ncbi:MAG TPA: cellulase family glycosylhydrolase, partial [Myxococcota bacterium]|nr:cellulase family glycosylhydrolase [Myxococcota bacterium]